MRIILNAPGVHHHTKEAVEQELEESLPRLRKILFQFRPEAKTLRAHMAAQKNNMYRLTLSIRMPGKNILVEKTGDAIIPLVLESRQALFEQIKVQTSVIRKEHLRQKTKLQEDAIQEAVGVPSIPSAAEADEEESRDRFSARLRLVLQDLHSHVTRLVRFAQLAGDVQPDYLKPAEIVDDVILRAYERIREQASEEISPQFLYTIADGIICDEINNYAETAEKTVSIEDKVPPQSPHWEVNDLNDEILEFYQPEEMLIYADIMPDTHVPDPVRMLGEEEQMQEISMCLSRLTPAARSAFLLNRVEGFEVYEIALMQDRAEEEISRDILLCEEQLVQGAASWR